MAALDLVSHYDRTLGISASQHQRGSLLASLMAVDDSLRIILTTPAPGTTQGLSATGSLKPSETAILVTRHAWNNLGFCRCQSLGESLLNPSMSRLLCRHAVLRLVELEMTSIFAFRAAASTSRNGIPWITQ